MTQQGLLRKVIELSTNTNARNVPMKVLNAKLRNKHFLNKNTKKYFRSVPRTYCSRIESFVVPHTFINPLNPELNPICYLLALLGAHHFLHVSRIRVNDLTLRKNISSKPLLYADDTNTLYT